MEGKQSLNMNTEIQKNIEELKNIIQLQDSFSIRRQIILVKKIGECPVGLSQLLKLLIERRLENIKSLGYVDGIIFKYLHSSKAFVLQNKMRQYFREGIVELVSSNSIDYGPLYKSLISNNFRAANCLTQKYLNILAGLHKDEKRQWLYFTDVLNFPSQDLKTIDTLWTIYSEGQFGFSIQRQVWLNSNKNWEQFWHRIGWKINKKNLRYPNEFIWDITAPEGHLPLFNQIRGVQVLAALFMHPALRDESQIIS